MNKNEINSAVTAESFVEEGERLDWKAYLQSVNDVMNRGSLPLVTYKVTYDNGQTVTVQAVDKFEASAEADEIIVTRGYSLDDLMFSPTVVQK